MSGISPAARWEIIPGKRGRKISREGVMLVMRESGGRAGRRRVLRNKSTPCPQVPGAGVLMLLLNIE